MTKEVELSISGLHTEAGEENAGVETVALGEYYKKNGSHYLFYQEALEGLEKQVRTRIVFEQGRLELVRQGGISTRMVFEKNKKHPVQYHTPYGKFLMGIDTKEVCVEETQDCIQVTVDYRLEAEEQYLSDSSIVIRIRERET